MNRPRSIVHALRRRIYRTGLIGFGRMPHVVQRWIVRLISPSYTVGAVLVLEHEGSVLALRQLHREGWTLPGGLLGHGEDPAATIARETGEELGESIVLSPPDDLPAATLVEAHVQRVDVIFHRVVTEKPPIHPRGEAFRAQWVPYDELQGVRGDLVTAQVLALLRRVHTR